jgi:acetyl esterase/lipase
MLLRIPRTPLACLASAWILASPASGADTKYPPIPPTHKDVAFLGPDRTEKMDIYEPGDGLKNRPAVVVIHGGGWSGGKKIWGYPVEFAKRAVPAGYVVFCPDYKLNEFEEIDGKKVSKRKAAPRNVQDSKDAVSFVRKHAEEYGVDPDRIAIAGDSAGGHLAMLAAYGANAEALGEGRLYPEVKPTVRCIVNFYGIANLETFPAWGGWTFIKSEKDPVEAKKPLLQHYSPVNYIRADSPPTLIVHGRNDSGVTWKQSEELAAKLNAVGVPCEFVTLERATKHAFNFDSDEMDLTRITLDFLDRHLRPAKGTAGEKK